MTSGLDGTGMSSELDRAYDYCQRVAKDRAKNF